MNMRDKIKHMYRDSYNATCDYWNMLCDYKQYGINEECVCNTCSATTYVILKLLRYESELESIISVMDTLGIEVPKGDIGAIDFIKDKVNELITELTD